MSLINGFIYTPGRQQSKTISKIDELGIKKSIETVFLIAICRQCGDKWQSETLFLKIFIYVPDSIGVFDWRLPSVI